MNVGIVAGLIREATGIGKYAGQRGAAGDWNRARMLHLAEHGNKLLREAGHIDDIVAAQAQIGQSIARLDQLPKLDPHHLVAAAVNRAPLGNRRYFVGAGHEAAARECFKQRGGAFKRYFSRRGHRAQHQHAIRCVLRHRHLDGKVVVVMRQRRLNRLARFRARHAVQLDVAGQRQRDAAVRSHHELGCEIGTPGNVDRDFVAFAEAIGLVGSGLKIAQSFQGILL